MSFILLLVNLIYHIDWFVGIEPSLHPWDKFHLVMEYDPCNVFSKLCCLKVLF